MYGNGTECDVQEWDLGAPHGNGNECNVREWDQVRCMGPKPSVTYRNRTECDVWEWDLSAVYRNGTMHGSSWDPAVPHGISQELEGLRGHLAYTKTQPTIFDSVPLTLCLFKRECPHTNWRAACSQ